MVLISDEIYREFCYDGPFVSPAAFNPQTLVVDGFSKTYGMPGWRLGFAHGPAAIIQRDDQAAAVQLRLRPAPVPVGRGRGHGRGHGPAHRGLPPQARPGGRGPRGCYELVAPGGAFYAFPRRPWGTATEFVTEAIEKHQLLIIPGNVFSQRDTHFRISYAAPDAVIARGMEVLRKMARK